MPLVDIPTTKYIQGISTAPGLVGIRQRIDARALPNLLAFARGFYDNGHGQLEINEGARSRPRQDMLWDNWEAYLARGKRPPVAALAAVPYTSIHDEVTHGTAVDLGSGIGTSTTAASVWAHKHGPEYGVRGTGVTFPVKEWWHFDIDKTSTAGSGTEIEDDDMNEEERDMLRRAVKAGEDNAFTLSQIKPVIDALNSGKGPVHAKLDNIAWAVADPKNGLRKLLSDFIAKLAK